MDVVDIDVHADGSGFGAFERARAAGLVQSWAWLVRTPSGGLHAYFPHSPGTEQRSWQVPNARIDLRGDGGYVIAPPSRLTMPDGTTTAYEVFAVATHEPAPADVNRPGFRGGSVTWLRP